MARRKTPPAQRAPAAPRAAPQLPPRRKAEGEFELVCPYQPTGDQPKAIETLVAGLQAGRRYQTLLGITGSGKTFTTAATIERIGRPALVLSPNKTLAAQL
jgi:excinuclease ABC subunit B